MRLRTALSAAWRVLHAPPRLTGDPSLPGPLRERARLGYLAEWRAGEGTALHWDGRRASAAIPAGKHVRNPSRSGESHRRHWRATRWRHAVSDSHNRHGYVRRAARPVVGRWHKARQPAPCPTGRIGRARAEETTLRRTDWAHSRFWPAPATLRERPYRRARCSRANGGRFRAHRRPARRKSRRLLREGRFVDILRGGCHLSR